ncbi:MAG: hypothetical protein D6762_02235 [Candidatus Neomarinimicrobiota bacterium]|nr:MAG: hypothetical protein D6762_02235 [Candidatus Neomarinimicrobiota bacterium]
MRNPVCEIVFRLGAGVILFGLVMYSQPLWAQPRTKLFSSLSSAEAAEDLQELIRTLEDVHPRLYFRADSVRIAARTDSLIRTFPDSLTALEFWVRVSPLVAALGDGHTFLSFPWEAWRTYRRQGGPAFPLKVRIENGRGYLTETDPRFPELPAEAEILAVNGIPFSAIAADLVRRISGERRSFREEIAGRNFAPFLWGLYPDWPRDYRITWRGTRGDSSRHTVRISGTTSPAATSSGSGPAPYSFREVPDRSVGIIDFRSMRDLSAFRSFLRSTFRTIRDDSLQALIIDIRRNGGGNSQLGDALIAYLTDQPYRQVDTMEVKASREARRFLIRRFVKWWQMPLLPLAVFHPLGRALLLKKAGTITTFTPAEKQPESVPYPFRGTVYLLTSRHTFSSANMLAITFKCYHLGTIIGEETGGVTVAYGDIVSFTLSHTGLGGGVSYKRFVHPCGREDGHGVIPDIPVPADRALETALEQIRLTMGSREK